MIFEPKKIKKGLADNFDETIFLFTTNHEKKQQQPNAADFLFKPKSY